LASSPHFARPEKRCVISVAPSTAELRAGSSVAGSEARHTLITCSPTGSAAGASAVVVSAGAWLSVAVSAVSAVSAVCPASVAAGASVLPHAASERTMLVASTKETNFFFIIFLLYYEVFYIKDVIYNI
jgi:hypothetical protein